MALVGNGVRLATSNPFRQLGGAQAGTIDRANWNRHGAARNFYAGEGTAQVGASIADKSATPGGYVVPYCWVPAQKSGGLASRGRITGAGTSSSANLAGGLNAVAPLTGSGDITAAALALIVSAVCTAAGAGTITIAGLNALGNVAASQTGTGSLAADVTAPAHMLASPAGAGEATGSMRADATISADIAASGEVLTTAGIASAVWAMTAEGALSFADVQRILLAVAAGKSVIIDNGGGTATVTFRDQADTKDRIEATMDGSERTGTTVDGS